MSHDVFISYSSKDKLAADAVCATLEARGVRCWIAPRDILPGMDWSGAIIDGISESRLVVLVFSSSANDSPQIKRELERAVNKGLPILPLRIENVPLSKPLEYFISTPHWLDALTPPMEKHLNYLADTVEVLLQRSNADRIPPLPAPRPQENSRLIWIAIVASVLVIAIGGVILARILGGGSKPAPVPSIEGETETPADNTRSDPQQQTLEPEPQGEQVTQQNTDRTIVDPDLIGTWHCSPTVDGKLWKFTMRIMGNGTYDFRGVLEDSGAYEAAAGRWHSRTAKGEEDSGTYTLHNAQTVTISGRYGTGMWTRTRSRSSRPGSMVDPNMAGTWRTSAIIDGKDFSFLFDIEPTGTFRITTTNTDSGTFQANNGTLKQISKKGTIIDGTYQILSRNSINLAGPAGAAVWTR